MSDAANRADLRATYDRHAQERDTSALPDWKLAQREAFLARLRAEGKTTLLEIGAGTGRDSLFFQEAGLQVQCVDLAPVMVALCRQKGLAAQVMDVCDLRFAPGTFDAVYAFNSLLHLAKAELPAALRQIEAVLRPQGLFYLGVYGGYDHAGVWEQDTYTPRRFFSFFSDAQLCSEVGRVFELLAFTPIALVPGDPLHFQAVLLRKRGQP